MTTRLFARRFRPVVSLLLLGGMLCTATAALGRDIDWKEGKLGHLSQYIGTYHYDAVLDDPKVAAALHALAGSASRILRANLNVVAPIEFVDECLVLQGNAPHEGGSEEAMVLIKPYDGTVRAALASMAFSP